MAAIERTASAGGQAGTHAGGPREALRVLFVSRVPTHPPNAGNRARVLNLVQAAMALGHEVHFAYLCDGEAPSPQMVDFFGPRLHVLSHRVRRDWRWAAEHLRRRVGQGLRLEAGLRWRLDAWYDERVTPRLAQLQAAHAFDVVVVEYVYLSKAFEAFGPGVRRIIDTHDRFTDRHRAVADGDGPNRWYSLSEADERRGLTRAHAVIAIADAEAGSFEHLLGGSVGVATVGHICPPAPTLHPSAAPVAIFVGSANGPNIDGARYFARHVLQPVRRRVPGFRWHVAGDVCAHLPDVEGLVKLGRVADVHAAYAQAALAVNPVYGGTGLCIKALEAMAMGIPLVTTPAGARGIEAYANEGFVRVDDARPEAFAQAVAGLLTDPARRAQLAARGQAAVLDFNRRQMLALQQVLRG